MTPNGHDRTGTALHGAVEEGASGARRPTVDGQLGVERAPIVSVVMPVYNAEGTLDECLRRLFQSRFQAFEVIVLDDGCTDGSREIMERYPVRIVSTSGRVGPAVARNQGAALARGEYLFFIDSDVMVRPDTLQILVDGFARDGVDGFCGVQSAAMRHDDIVSQYKNLWMRWTYLRKSGDVPLFYTTAAAIRRDTFERVGGFDAGYATPNVEDTEFGQKLNRLGIQIRVHPQLEVEHVKPYSLSGFLRVDYMRAVSLTLLKLRHPQDLMDNNTSIPIRYMISIPLAGLAALAIVLGLVVGWRGATIGGILGALAVAGLNAGFLNAIRRSDGLARALGSVPLLWLELLVVGAGVLVGMTSFAVGRRY